MSDFVATSFFRSRRRDVKQRCDNLGGKQLIIKFWSLSWKPSPGCYDVPVALLNRGCLDGYLVHGCRGFSSLSTSRHNRRNALKNAGVEILSFAGPNDPERRQHRAPTTLEHFPVFHLTYATLPSTHERGD
jgi:hypothetical protein